MSWVSPLTPSPKRSGATRNPWNVDPHTVRIQWRLGGSGCVAHGADRPRQRRGRARSACLRARGGLVGLKPTNAPREPRSPSSETSGVVLPSSTWSLAQSVTLRRSSTPSRSRCRVIPAPMDWVRRAVRRGRRRHPEQPLRIGLMDSHAGTNVHADCVEAVQAAATTLEELGHHVDPSYPAAIEHPDFATHFSRQVCASVAWLLDHYWPQHTGVPVTEPDVEPLTWTLAKIGRNLNGGDYLAGREAQQLFSRDIAQVVRRWQLRPAVDPHDAHASPRGRHPLRPSTPSTSRSPSTPAASLRSPSHCTRAATGSPLEFNSSPDTVERTSCSRSPRSSKGTLGGRPASRPSAHRRPPAVVAISGADIEPAPGEGSPVIGSAM